MATEMMAGSNAGVLVKDEEDCVLPEPMPGLHGSMLPSFLKKTFEIVEDMETDDIVSWSMERNSFVVWDPYRLSSDLLPRYFKHGNFSSFIRQLNTYGFRKVFPDRWEFAHEKFLGGQKHLLKDIKRRRSVGQRSQHKVGAGGSIELGQETGFCPELGQFELDRMKREHSILVAEIESLKQQQQSYGTQILAMEELIHGTERMQQRTAAFLARAFKNPLFIEQLLLQREQKKQQLESLGRKRRLTAITSSEKADNGADMMNPLSTMGKDGGTSSRDRNGNAGKDGGTSSRDRNGNAVLQSGGQDFGVIGDVFWEDFLDIGKGEGDQPEVEVEVEHQAAYQYNLF